MVRRRSLAALVTALLLVGVLPGIAAAVPPPLPASMAAVGDSITQAASSGGSLGTDYPQNSWSTGTNGTVNSHYLRLQALNPAIGGQATNLSVSGAKVADLQAQMVQVGQRDPDYLTVAIGGNDLCTPTEAQMTPVATFRAQFEAAMATLAAEAPGTRVYVVSIPRALGLWELFKDNGWARFIWSIGNICQSLLANPTSTQAADVERRARVAQRNIDYNTQLAAVCAAAPNCLWDGNAVYNTAFVSSDVSGDFFHPSIQGQAKLASVSWGVGYWAAGAPPPPPPENVAPTARFTYSCADLTCSFDGRTSSDGDGSVVAHAWAFGGDGTGSGAQVSHTFSAAGTYSVTLTVTDDDGATDDETQSVSVSAPQPPAGSVHVAALSGAASSRKGGWTAEVTIIVADGAGARVSGATVTGTWSAGGSTTCTTGATGTCSAATPMNRKATSVTWTVSTITHATLAYDPSANVVESVTISRP